jgi:hypothetical protein
MQRRAFLQNIGVTAGFAVTSVAVQPWERLAAALRQPSRLDREIVAELEHVTVTLEGLESQVSPKALLGPVVGHLDTVASLLKGSPRPSLRQQLGSIAGETAGLAGWLTWDLEDRKAAGAYFHTGIQAAQEADDRALGAYLVGSSCVQPAYRERPHARLRRLDGTTHGFTRADATPSTQAWLVTLEAEAHALAGDEPATLRAMDEADAIMSRRADEPSARRPRVAFFPPTSTASAASPLPGSAGPTPPRTCWHRRWPPWTRRRSRPGPGCSPPWRPPTSVRATSRRPASSAPTPSRSPPAKRSRPTSKTSAYVTDEQWRWLSRLAAQARLDELPCRPAT